MVKGQGVKMAQDEVGVQAALFTITAGNGSSVGQEKPSSWDRGNLLEESPGLHARICRTS